MLQMNPNHSTLIPPLCPPAFLCRCCVMVGGRRAHLFPSLYLPKPGVAQIQRMSNGKGILSRGFLLHEDSQENTTNVILEML